MSNIYLTSNYKYKNIKVINNLFNKKKITINEKIQYINLLKNNTSLNKINRIIKNNKILKENNNKILKDITENKKVSIIMPLYNLGKYKHLLNKAITSVINQTYKKWELIIIDDFSSDETYEYLLNYLEKNENKKIKVFRNDVNRGCYYTFNVGITKSTGDYITRLDSDDYFTPDKLTRQVSILEKNNNIVCTYCYCQRINTNNIVIPNTKTYAPTAGMFKKDIINKMGYFDNVRISGDSEFKDRMYRVYGKKRINNYPKVLYKAIRRPDSLTTSKNTGNKNFSKKGWEERIKYLKRYQNWHSSDNNLYMPFPLEKKLF